MDTHDLDVDHELTGGSFFKSDKTKRDEVIKKVEDLDDAIIVKDKSNKVILPESLSNNNDKIISLTKKAKTLANSLDKVLKYRGFVINSTHTILEDVAHTKLFELINESNKRIESQPISVQETAESKAAQINQIPPKNKDEYFKLYNVIDIRKVAIQKIREILDIYAKIYKINFEQGLTDMSSSRTIRKKTDELEKLVDNIAYDAIKLSNRAEAARLLAIAKSVFDTNQSDVNKVNLENAITNAIHNLVFYDMIHTYPYTPEMSDPATSGPAPATLTTSASVPIADVPIANVEKAKESLRNITMFRVITMLKALTTLSEPEITQLSGIIGEDTKLKKILTSLKNKQWGLGIKIIDDNINKYEALTRDINEPAVIKTINDATDKLTHELSITGYDTYLKSAKVATQSEKLKVTDNITFNYYLIIQIIEKIGGLLNIHIEPELIRIMYGKSESDKLLLRVPNQDPGLSALYKLASSPPVTGGPVTSDPVTGGPAPPAVNSDNPDATELPAIAEAPKSGLQDNTKLKNVINYPIIKNKMDDIDKEIDKLTKELQSIETKNKLTNIRALREKYRQILANTYRYSDVSTKLTQLEENDQFKSIISSLSASYTAWPASNPAVPTSTGGPATPAPDESNTILDKAFNAILIRIKIQRPQINTDERNPIVPVTDEERRFANLQLVHGTHIDKAIYEKNYKVDNLRQSANETKIQLKSKLVEIIEKKDLISRMMKGSGENTLPAIQLKNPSLFSSIHKKNEKLTSMENNADMLASLYVSQQRRVDAANELIAAKINHNSSKDNENNKQRLRVAIKKALDNLVFLKMDEINKKLNAVAKGKDNPKIKGDAQYTELANILAKNAKELVGNNLTINPHDRVKVMRLLDEAAKNYVMAMTLVGSDRLDAAKITPHENSESKLANQKQTPPKNVDYYKNIYNVNDKKKSAIRNLDELITRINNTDTIDSKIIIAKAVIKNANTSKAAENLAIVKSAYDNDQSIINVEELKIAIRNALNNFVFIDVVHPTNYTASNTETEIMIQPKWSEASEKQAISCITTMKYIAKSTQDKRLLFQNLANDLNVLLMTI